MTADQVAKIAKKHRGRYLITMGEWRMKEGDAYAACAGLVRAGRARWLYVKPPGSDELGEPGPGIKLIGRDAAEIHLED